MVLEFFRSNPIAVGQLVLSVALVGATIAYTAYTRAQTREMAATRETANQPVLQGGVLTHAPTLMMAEFRNTGNAAAHDLSAEIRFEDLDIEPLTYSLPVVAPGEDHRFTLPIDGDRQQLRKRDEVRETLQRQGSSGVLTFEFTCENPFGDEYEYSNDVDVLDWLDNSSSVVDYTETAKLRDAVEGIESSLDTIENEL